MMLRHYNVSCTLNHLISITGCLSVLSVRSVSSVCLPVCSTTFTLRGHTEHTRDLGMITHSAHNHVLPAISNYLLFEHAPADSFIVSCYTGSETQMKTIQ